MKWPVKLKLPNVKFMATHSLVIASGTSNWFEYMVTPLHSDTVLPPLTYSKLTIQA